MTKKRSNRGRSKGGKGSAGNTQCSKCGAMVPRDKAIKKTTPVSFIAANLAKELRQAGAYVPISTDTRAYCVSCGIHIGIVGVRAESERR